MGRDRPIECGTFDCYSKGNWEFAKKDPEAKCLGKCLKDQTEGGNGLIKGKLS